MSAVHHHAMPRAVLPLMLLALVAACGPGESPTGPSGGGAADPVVLSNGFMNARIDGTRWDAARLYATVLSTGLPATTLGVGGESDPRATGTFIMMSVPHAVGTHTIGATLALVTFQLAQNGSEALWAAGVGLGGSGTVTLTIATPTRAAGTFSFTARELSGLRSVPAQRGVTNGAFDVTF